MAGKVQSPEKELRFTRSGQATHFGLLSAVCASMTLTLVATSLYREVNPELPHPAWALVPLGFAAFSAWLAVRLTRHAYLILSPLGIEIFPFYRPMTEMQLIVWQEVDSAEVNTALTRLTLHRDAEKTSGIHLSLRPIRKDRRELLAKAVIGRAQSGRN